MKLIYGLAGFVVMGLFILDCGAKPTRDSLSSHDHKKKEKPTAEEESDMLMEPDEYSQVAVVRAQSHQIYPGTTAEYSDAGPTESDSHSQAAQNLYPPFFRQSPPLGHSRPYFTGSEGQPPHAAKFVSQTPRGFDQTILGSGDFGVIRGGTFYPEDEVPFQSEDNSEFNQFYGDNANNGHGRPQADAYVQKYTYPEEQFENFRDFADINTPGESAFSQFVVVYAAKNSTSNHPNPKNIFEQLQLLDKEKAVDDKKNPVSKTKAKLEQTKLEKKYKKKLGPKDLDYEPLLALS